MTALWYITWQRALTEAEEQVLTAHLPPARLTRLGRTRSPQRRTEVLCAYGLLCLALREQCGWSELPPIDLTERGKPYFPDFPQLRFSISHTEGAALVGLSGEPIGVDIEKLRPVSGRLKTLLGEPLTDEEALRCWTCREAHAKRTGIGITEAKQPQLHLEKGERCVNLDVPQPYFAAASFFGPAPEGLHQRRIGNLLQI